MVTVGRRTTKENGHGRGEGAADRQVLEPDHTFYPSPGRSSKDFMENGKVTLATRSNAK